MALSEEQEKNLLASNESLTKQLKELLPAIESLKPLSEKVTKLEAENTELKKGFQSSSQELAINALKTKYPDVPESVIRNTPEASREVVLKDVQDKFSTVKASQAKTDPLDLWANTGGIGPTDEAERAAAHKQKAEAYEASKGKGDLMGMLTARSADIVRHVRGSFAKK